MPLLIRRRSKTTSEDALAAWQDHRIKSRWRTTLEVPAMVLLGVELYHNVYPYSATLSRIEITVTLLGAISLFHQALGGVVTLATPPRKLTL